MSLGEPSSSFIVGLRVGLLRRRHVGSPAQSLGKFYGPSVDLHASYNEHAQQRGPLKKSFMAFNSKLGLVLWLWEGGEGEGDLQQLGYLPSRELLQVKTRIWWSPEACRLVYSEQLGVTAYSCKDD